jgi:hypothetical protein
MKYSFLHAIIILGSLGLGGAQALEVDEKLTLRFLKVSSTKKTVLINRGAEDGLVVGDHAKFYITEGVVARGVSEKVSPSRSVWSLYRIIDTTEIVQDKVLNLKISTPVKITEDPSKSMKEEAIPGGAESMSTDDATVESGNDEKEIVVTDEEQDELRGLGVSNGGKSAVTKKTSKNMDNKTIADMEDIPVASSNSRKDWEAWGTLYVNSLSGTIENEGSESTSTATSTVDFSAGIEKYFLNSTGFLRELSLVGFVHKRTIENGSDVKTTSDWFEFGAGLNYHFYNSAAQTNTLIGFGTLTAGKGSGSLKLKLSSGTAADEVTREGTNTFLSFGVGAKYVLTNGFGIRAILDYYKSGESFEYEVNGIETVTEQTLSGPRIQFGMSYRF